MARRIVDAVNPVTGDPIYFKGHAKATYMSDGVSVETTVQMKQDTLVSGQNIKTINNVPILGSGNIVIPKGDKGDKGDTGPIGPQGPQGLQGNSGYTGAANELQIVNNLTDGGETAALSAEQGKILKSELTELSSEIMNNSFVGTDLTASFAKIVGLQPNHSYRVYLPQTEWSKNNTPLGQGYAIFVIRAISNGVQTNLVRISTEQMLSEFYDIITPMEFDYIEIGGRADVGVDVRFSVVETNYCNKKVEEAKAELNDNILAEGSEILRSILEVGGITGLAEGVISYLEYPTRARTKIYQKILLYEGDEIAVKNGVNNLRIYVGGYNFDGTYTKYMWNTKITITKDCNAVMLIEDTANANIDIDYVVNSLTIKSAKKGMYLSRILSLEKLTNTIEDLRHFVGQILGSTAETKRYTIDLAKCFSAKAMPSVITIYAETSGTNQPTLSVKVGVYQSIEYSIKNREFQQLRIPPILENMDATITFKVPKNSTLKVDNISCDLAYVMGKHHRGLRLNSHLGFLKYAPEQTKVSFDAAALMGYDGCIVNPIKTKDGVWMCYHEDKAYLSLDGTKNGAVALTAADFQSKTFEEIRAYDVITSDAMYAIWGSQKVPTLAEFVEVCAKTAMRPIFSAHPVPSFTEWQELKDMLVKHNLLQDLTIKTFDLTSLVNAFAVMGNEIETYEVITYETSKDSIESLCNDFKSRIDTTCRMGVEFGTTSAITDEILSMVASKGIYSTCSILPTSVTSDTFDTYISRGICEFTDDHYVNSGLKW